MTHLVWINRVYSKNFITDFFQKLKNIVGGRLKAYEEMINEAIQDTTDEFENTYPDAINKKLDIEQLSDNAVMVVITGEVN